MSWTDRPQSALWVAVILGAIVLALLVAMAVRG